MNRQEKRRLERKKQTTYKLTPEQLLALNTEAYNKVNKEFDKNFKAIQKDLLDEAFSMFISVPLLTARDHLGFGKKRLFSFAQKLVEVYNDWDNQTISTNDILEALKDETGLDLKFSIDYKNQKSKLVLK